MPDTTNTYGDFTEPKEPISSRRSEEVVLRAVEKCEKLEDDLISCVRILYKQPDYQRWCEKNFPDIVMKLRGRK